MNDLTVHDCQQIKLKIRRTGKVHSTLEYTYFPETFFVILHISMAVMFIYY